MPAAQGQGTPSDPSARLCLHTGKRLVWRRAKPSCRPWGRTPWRQRSLMNHPAADMFVSTVIKPSDSTGGSGEQVQPWTSPGSLRSRGLCPEPSTAASPTQRAGTAGRRTWARRPACKRHFWVMVSGRACKSVVCFLLWVRLGSDLAGFPSGSDSATWPATTSSVPEHTTQTGWEEQLWVTRPFPWLVLGSGRPLSGFHTPSGRPSPQLSTGSPSTPPPAGVFASVLLCSTWKDPAERGADTWGQIPAAPAAQPGDRRQVTGSLWAPIVSSFKARPHPKPQPQP